MKTDLLKKINGTTVITAGLIVFLLPFIISFFFESGVLLPIGFIGVIIAIIGVFLNDFEK